VSDTVHSVRLAPIISRFEPLAPISFLVNKDRIFRCFTVLASTLDRCSLSEIKYSATPLNYTSQAAFRAHRHLHVAEIQRYRVLTVPAGCCSAVVRSHLAQPHETTGSTPSRHETAMQRTCSDLHSLEDTKFLCRPHDDATFEDSYRLLTLRVLHFFSKDHIENLLRLPRPLRRRALRRSDVRNGKQYFGAPRKGESYMC
jgi:hypothetical protein